MSRKITSRHVDNMKFQFFIKFAGKILWCDSSNATKPSQSQNFRAFFCIYEIEFGTLLYTTLHRILKWRTREKKLMPSHESKTLEDKQKLQMKTFGEHVLHPIF